jgi:hypothetical protein
MEQQPPSDLRAIADYLCTDPALRDTSSPRTRFLHPNRASHHCHKASRPLTLHRQTNLRRRHDLPRTRRLVRSHKHRYDPSTRQGEEAPRTDHHQPQMQQRARHTPACVRSWRAGPRLARRGLAHEGRPRARPRRSRRGRCRSDRRGDRTRLQARGHRTHSCLTTGAAPGAGPDHPLGSGRMSCDGGPLHSRPHSPTLQKSTGEKSCALYAGSRQLPLAVLKGREGAS